MDFDQLYGSTPYNSKDWLEASLMTLLLQLFLMWFCAKEMESSFEQNFTF